MEKITLGKDGILPIIDFDHKMVILHIDFLFDNGDTPFYYKLINNVFVAIHNDEYIIRRERGLNDLQNYCNDILTNEIASSSSCLMLFNDKIEYEKFIMKHNKK